MDTPTSLYKVTNLLDGKRYIGITSRRLSVRRGSHFAEMRRGSNARFHNALRKYGRDAFKWEVIAVLCSRQEAAETEIRAIAAMRPEYNIHSGGDVGSAGLPFEVRDAMNSAKRKPVRCIDTGDVFRSCKAASDAFGIDQTSIAECCRGKNHHAKGLKFVFEADYKAGTARLHTSKGKSSKCRKVVCINTGVVYGSLCAAAKDNYTTAANIRMVCQGKRRIAGGVSFRYENETAPIGPTGVKAKLTAADVTTIRRLDGSVSRKEIAAKYGVTDRTISDIVRRKSWGYLQ